SPEAIVKYVQWATRLDSPMIWETPTPIGCTVDSSSPLYIVCPSFCDPVSYI
ncbi:hypothetical protein BJV74DRAFT_772276, partial [Russula compacta]